MITGTSGGRGASYSYDMAQSGTYGSSGVARNLSARSYTISVKDKANCAFTTSVTVNEPSMSINHFPVLEIIFIFYF